jgi:purine nucleoside phosphorylase
MLAIIGGSGLTTLSNLDVSHREVVRTPYGEPSGALVFGQICGSRPCFCRVTATGTVFRRIW